MLAAAAEDDDEDRPFPAALAAFTEATAVRLLGFVRGSTGFSLAEGAEVMLEVDNGGVEMERESEPLRLEREADLSFS